MYRCFACVGAALIVTWTAVRIIAMGWVSTVLYSPAYVAQMLLTGRMMTCCVVVPMLLGYGAAYYLQWHWYTKIIQGAFVLLCPGKKKKKKKEEEEETEKESDEKEKET